jgi:release factor glutamine methyltransferase
VTWAELRASAEHRLLACGIGDAATEARWMLEQVSGMDPAEQIMRGRSSATRRAVTALDELVERRAAGEPLQYVLGSWGFCGLDLLVDRRVLIPRPETEVVAQLAIEELRRRGERVGRRDAWAGTDTAYAVADLGTGSGALALALAAALPDAQVWATDVSAEALSVARANIAAAGTPSARVRTAHGSWFEALAPELCGQLLMVVANPPYIGEHEREELPTEVRDWEPEHALISGPTGLEAIAHLIVEAPRWLRPDGVLVLELAPHQAERAVQMATDAGFVDVEVAKDLAARDRVLIARRESPSF